MTWNHRVLRHLDGPRSQTLSGEWYAVHEVYYDDSGRARSCTVNPVAPIGETPEELLEELSRYVAALGQPVLDYDSFTDAKTYGWVDGFEELKNDKGSDLSFFHRVLGFFRRSKR